MTNTVLTWSADKCGKLRVETPMKFKTAAKAKGRVERSEDRFAGVVAFSQGYDVDTKQEDESPLVLFPSGRTPAELEE